MTDAPMQEKDTSVVAPLTLELSERQDRVTLHMTVQRLGADCHVTLWGGDAHVGAVALALPEAHSPHEPSPGVSVLAVPGHREDELARHVAHTLCAALHCRVSVVCGIHYDHITKEEIALVLTLADRLTHRALHVLALPVTDM